MTTGGSFHPWTLGQASERNLSLSPIQIWSKAYWTVKWRNGQWWFYTNLRDEVMRRCPDHRLNFNAAIITAISVRIKFRRAAVKPSAPQSTSRNHVPIFSSSSRSHKSAGQTTRRTQVMKIVFSGRKVGLTAPSVRWAKTTHDVGNAFWRGWKLLEINDVVLRSPSQAMEPRVDVNPFNQKFLHGCGLHGA